MILRLIQFVLFLLLSVCSYAQSDTIKQVRDTVHSVRKATLLSAVVPGAGQIYNHIAQPKGKKNAYWKVPLIYGALGFAGYSIISNHSQVLSLRKEYYFREQNPGAIGENEWKFYSADNLVLLESQKAGQRDYAILGFIFGWALQVADAAVEAHFVHFDISEDLTMRIRPWSYQTNYTGLSLSFNFR